MKQHKWDKQVPLPSDVLEEIKWWNENLSRVNGKKFDIQEPDIIIYSDASLIGWGAYSDGATARGPWAIEDSEKHINELELLAAFNALRLFTERDRNMSVRLYLDNMTSLCYLNNGGGSHSMILNSLSPIVIKW